MNERYRKLYEKNKRWIERKAVRKKIVLCADKAATWYVVLSYLFVCAYALFVEKRCDGADYVRLFVLPAACLIVVSLLRKIVNAKRPYESGISPIAEKKRKGQSFPSRHLASTAAISGIALFYLPVVGAINALACCVLSYTRFACGWHFPRDILCGFSLGAICCIPLFFI